MIEQNFPALKRMAQDGIYKIKVISNNSWFKWIVVALVALIILTKDFSFSFSINSNPSGIDVSPESRATTLGIPSSTSSTQKVVIQKPIVLSETEQKQANRYGNLSFVLNPALAKKHGVSDRIVAYKLQLCRNYVSKLKKMADIEQRKHHIPASITLAQALLETNAGFSTLSQKANNHFGIKCFSKSCSKGHCMNLEDDSHKDFFRMYKNVKESVEARSQFLKKKRYRHLLDLSVSDYKNWAHGLRAAGYATDPNYGDKLIKIIEGLGLDG